jgi:hypothetical protein
MLVLALGAGTVQAGSVNPALPLFSRPGAVSKHDATSARARLMFVIPSTGARQLALRFYPDPGIGRMDAGMFRMSAASAPAYERFVDETVGVYGSVRRDSPASPGL